jgi:rRNA pseudouridine-1189 N-methylase Emg1 (Nep1/Mra1 family)
MEAPVTIDAKVPLGSPMALISSSSDGHNMAARVGEARPDIAERLRKTMLDQYLLKGDRGDIYLHPESFFE